MRWEYPPFRNPADLSRGCSGSSRFGCLLKPAPLMQLSFRQESAWDQSRPIDDVREMSASPSTPDVLLRRRERSKRADAVEKGFDSIVACSPEAFVLTQGATLVQDVAVLINEAGRDLMRGYLAASASLPMKAIAARPNFDVPSLGYVVGHHSLPGLLPEVFHDQMSNKDSRTSTRAVVRGKQ
jgi:hypothetical protein